MVFLAFGCFFCVAGDSATTATSSSEGWINDGLMMDGNGLMMDGNGW
jgi:hypothetical protein